MNKPFRLRQATALDRANIVALVKAILPDFGLTYSPVTSEKDLQDLEHIYTHAGGLFLIVEDEEGMLIGTAALLKLDATKCKLRKMYVAKPYRGQGLGRRLLQELIERARVMGFREMQLETVHSMQAALRLYESVGFRPIARIADSPRCDMVMQLTLC